MPIHRAQLSCSVIVLTRCTDRLSSHLKGGIFTTQPTQWGTDIASRTTQLDVDGQTGSNIFSYNLHAHYSYTLHAQATYSNSYIQSCVVGRPKQHAGAVSNAASSALAKGQ